MCISKAYSMCHVLIIEDEPMVALELEWLLGSVGATSFAFAQSEAEAVSMALEQPPSFITSDVKLAEGTGPQAIFAIHEALGAIPVVYITGTPSACHPNEPVQPVLSKPFDRSAVLLAFQRCDLG
jgi:CheY-like chemotaxis protein